MPRLTSSFRMDLDRLAEPDLSGLALGPPVPSADGLGLAMGLLATGAGVPELLEVLRKAGYQDRTTLVAALGLVIDTDPTEAIRRMLSLNRHLADGVERRNQTALDFEAAGWDGSLIGQPLFQQRFAPLGRSGEHILIHLNPACSITLEDLLRKGLPNYATGPLVSPTNLIIGVPMDPAAIRALPRLPGPIRIRTNGLALVVPVGPFPENSAAYPSPTQRLRALLDATLERLDLRPTGAIEAGRALGAPDPILTQRSLWWR